MYVLRFPLRPIHIVTGLDTPVVEMVADRPVEFRYSAPQVIVAVRRLPTVEDAASFANRLWTGCKWALVTRGLDSEASLDLDEPTYASDPGRLAEGLAAQFGGETRPALHGIASG